MTKLVNIVIVRVDHRFIVVVLMNILQRLIKRTVRFVVKINQQAKDFVVIAEKKNMMVVVVVHHNKYISIQIPLV